MSKLRFSFEKSINITPLIDVIFIILTFLLITYSFSKEGFFDIDLPRSKLSLIKEKKNKNVLIIKANGDIYFDNQKVEDLKKLESLLTKKKIKSLEIKGDKNVKYALIIKIMDIATKSKIKKVILTTEKEL